VLRFLMPLTAPDAVIEEGFDILEKTIGQVLEASAKRHKRHAIVIRHEGRGGDP